MLQGLMIIGALVLGAEVKQDQSVDKNYELMRVLVENRRRGNTQKVYNSQINKNGIFSNIGNKQVVPLLQNIQGTYQNQAEKQPNENDRRGKPVGILEVEYNVRQVPTPQSEVDAALKFAKEVAQCDPDAAQFLKFFSTYNIPEANQEEMFYVLSFWIHSLIAPGFNIVAVPQRVPYSPTLWYVYFYNYGWLRESFEFVVKTEPYFREPWVHFEDLNNLRLLTGGNSIVRADWFVMHTSDTTRQFDRNDPNILYYILIYGQGKEPKNLKEFQDAWGVDLAGARARGTDAATILKSYIVSRHNRQLLRVRTETGYYWDTFDVKNEDKERDYIENLFPDNNARDAAEAIVTNGVGLQVYLLVAFNNGVDVRVEFGDPTVVRAIRDPHGDVRVRTARSCVTCHAEGIISFKHELRDLLNDPKNKFCLELAGRIKEIQLEIQRFYFGPIEEFVEDDKAFFRRAIKCVNSQTPIDNTMMFNNVMLAYDRPVDVETAAKECGVPVSVFKERLSLSVSGRLLGLINGKTIPRTVWENQIINAGTFGHAMLFAHAIQKKDLLNECEKKDDFGPLNQPTHELNLNGNILKQNDYKNKQLQQLRQKLKNQTPAIKKQETKQEVKKEVKKKERTEALVRQGAFFWITDIPQDIRHKFKLYSPDGYARSNKYLGYVRIPVDDYHVIVDDEYRDTTEDGVWRKVIVFYSGSVGLVEVRGYVLERDLIFIRKEQKDTIPPFLPRIE